MSPTEQAAPSPGIGSLYEICLQGISFHVTVYGVEVLIALHRKRLESALIKVSGARAMAMSVPLLHAGESKPSRKFRKPTIVFGPDNQMPVIGHHNNSAAASATVAPLRSAPFQRLHCPVPFRNGSIGHWPDRAHVRSADQGQPI